MSSPRKHPFRLGVPYRVVCAFSSLDEFSAGEALMFIGSSYSSYDSSSGFDFEDENGGRKRWNIHDEEGDALFAERFREEDIQK